MKEQTKKRFVFALLIFNTAFIVLLLTISISILAVGLRYKEKIISDVQGTALANYIQPDLPLKLMAPGIKFIEDFYPFRKNPKHAEMEIEKWIVRLSNKTIAGLNADLEKMDAVRRNKEDFRHYRRWHNCVLIVDNKEYPCRIRWRGSYLHWKYDKKSMKIEFNWGNPFRQMKEFHLIIPMERGWISDYCFNFLSEKYDLITLKNQYCFLFINNQAHGLYYMIEDPSFYTLERTQRPKGVLFKPRRPKGIQNPYQEEYIFRKTSEIQSGSTDAIQEFVSVDKYMIYSAICAIFGTHHDENERFYLNPLTRKVEPIPYDTNIAAIRNGLWAYDRRAIDPILKAMLSIPELRYLRNRYLFSMIHKERSALLQKFDDLYERIESPIEMDRNKVHATFLVKKTIESYRRILQKNMDTILADITGKSATMIKSDIIEPKITCTFTRNRNGNVVMDVSNQFMHSIKMDKVTMKDGSQHLSIRRVNEKKEVEDSIMMESQKAETWKFASNDSNDLQRSQQAVERIFARPSIMDREKFQIPQNIFFGQTRNLVELQEASHGLSEEEFVNLEPSFTNAFTNEPIDPRFLRVLYRKPRVSSE